MSNFLNDCQLSHIKSLIDGENLTTVINRLIYVEGWSKEGAVEACKQYRNFLYLQLKYNGQYKQLPPSADIDEAWHAHILHTKDYSTFCENVFGYFLHHNPQSAFDNISSKEQPEHLFEQTQKLYYREFDEYIYSVRRKYLLTSFNRWLLKTKRLLLRLFITQPVGVS